MIILLQQLNTNVRIGLTVSINKSICNPKKIDREISPYHMCIKIYKIEKSRDRGQNWYMLATWMPCNIPTNFFLSFFLKIAVLAPNSRSNFG